MIFILVVTYIAFLVAVPIFGYRRAKGRGWPRSKRWVAAALWFLVVLPVFWDWLPTIWLHSHYCKNYGGLSVNKTLDQWELDNPGVANTLVGDNRSSQISTPDGYYYDLNRRIRWQISHQEIALRLRKSEIRLTDTKTNQLIATFVDFSTGQASGRLEGARELRDIKFWMYRNSCERDGHTVDRKRFNVLSSAFQHLGKK